MNTDELENQNRVPPEGEPIKKETDRETAELADTFGRLLNEAASAPVPSTDGAAGAGDGSENRVSSDVPVPGEEVVPVPTESETVPAVPAEEAPGNELAPGQTLWTFEGQAAADRAGRTGTEKGARTYAIVMTALFVVCFGILAAMIFSGYNMNAMTPDNRVYIDRTVYVREPGMTGGALTVSEVQAKLQPSTVGISVTTGVGSGVGTGIVLSDDGYIATNYHVIENAKTIRVTLYDKTELEAELVGGDELSDVAVIRASVHGLKLTPAEFGDSDNLIVGEGVVAIGNPAGLDYAGTVTTGIVSAINRGVKIYSENGLLEKTMTLIQTNANLNPGNSGGPLIDMNGRVIGINTMKLADDYDGICFAIPINGAQEIIKEIIETGSYSGGAVAERGVSLGITCTDVTEGDRLAVNSTFSIEAGRTGILVIEEAAPSGSAYGLLKLGDIITAIDGKTVTETNAMKSILFTHHAGDTVVLTVYRDNAEISVEIVLK